MTTPASPVTPLSETESWSRLSGVTLGRLATSLAGQPDIFPVNFFGRSPRCAHAGDRGSAVLTVVVDSTAQGTRIRGL